MRPFFCAKEIFYGAFLNLIFDCSIKEPWPTCEKLESIIFISFDMKNANCEGNQSKVAKFYV